MSKPFHEMTPAERIAFRIAQNRAIDEKVAVSGVVSGKAKASTPKPKRPPVASTREFIRETPEERAARSGALIRKLES